MTNQGDRSAENSDITSVSAEVSQDAAKTVEEGLDRFNESQVGPALTNLLWVIQRDDRGDVVGGLQGHTIWNWLVISMLWVRDDSRYQGIGSKLLADGENAARDRGCTRSQLVTMSFQAPEFYKRFGYSEAGRIADFPPGHSYHWMIKELS